MTISVICESFQSKVKEFVRTHLSPAVQEIEEKQYVDNVLLQKLADSNFFGANIPKQYGGQSLNSEELGILHREMGKGHASVENILTVVGMASVAILRGSAKLRTTWLPKIARGEVIPAFALTEPYIGSDIQNIETYFRPTKTGYVLNGKKKWITLGTRADIFIIFAKNSDKSAAFFVPKDTPGVEIRPIKNMLGFRGNMLAEIHLDNCCIPTDYLIGTEGGGIKMVASFALNEGRYTTAWGAVGSAEGAFEIAIEHVKQRKQFGKLLQELDIVKQTLAKMTVSLEASRQLCKYAGVLKDQGDPKAVKACLMAKYHASKMVVRVTEKAVQLLGAKGCHREGLVERYFRDSKLFELIEGSSEVLEMQIADLTLCEGLDECL